MCEDAAWPHDIDESSRQNICLYLESIREKKSSEKDGASFSCSACVSEGLKGIVAPVVPSHWDLGQIRCVSLLHGPPG